MIPENDPFVQPETAFSTFVKPESEALPMGPLPVFSQANEDALTRTVTAFSDPARPLELADMMRLIKQAEDARSDDDVKLVRALMSLGAMISVSPLYETGPIHVTLPSRFQRAIDIIADDKATRQRTADAYAKYAVPRLYHLPLHSDPHRP